jgi:uncharacterized membrane protein
MPMIDGIGPIVEKPAHRRIDRQTFDRAAYFSGNPSIGNMKRLPAIDIARGLVMIIMALDHTRDYLHIHAAQSPTDLTTTTPILFFTRWITHLCAPSFVFLSGASAWLYLHSPAPGTPSSADTLRTRRRFLLQRGLVLILIEFTFVNFALFFDVHFRLFIFEVIATIGSGLFLLSFLSRLKPGVLPVIAFLLFAGHNILDLTTPALGFIGALLFAPGGFPLPAGRLLVIAYPILPWLGIMLLGFSAGRVFVWPAEKQKKFFGRAGLAAIGLFIVLRLVNVYGDPARWSGQKNSVYTALSFMNVTKYPPSLLFGLATLGVLCLILAMAAKTTGKPETAVSQVLLVYGRVPLFYFIVHLYLIHGIMLVMVLCQGYS